MPMQKALDAPQGVCSGELGNLLCWLFLTYPQTPLCPALPRLGAPKEADLSPLHEGPLAGVSQRAAPWTLKGREAWVPAGSCMSQQGLCPRGWDN